MVWGERYHVAVAAPLSPQPCDANQSSPELSVKPEIENGVSTNRRLGHDSRYGEQDVGYLNIIYVFM